MTNDKNTTEQSIYVNRELSWLKFNERVLEEAEDETVPLLERLKFVSIFSSNLDEFYMVRVGSLHDQNILTPDLKDNKSGWTAKRQLREIFPATRELLLRKDSAYNNIMNELKKYSLITINSDKLADFEEGILGRYFEDEILPLLSPQIIDKHHPFPFFKNKESYIGVHLEGKGEQLRLGIIPIPHQLDKIFSFRNGEEIRITLIERIIKRFSYKIFKKYNVIDSFAFRITRNADISADEAMFDNDMDWRDVMADLLVKRRKLVPVRLQIDKEVNTEMLSYLCDKLELSKEQVFLERTPLDMSFAFGLIAKYKSINPMLIYDELTPVLRKDILQNVGMIKQIREKDIFLSYPYQSIKPFIRLLDEAAEDPEVVSIKITLYRVAQNSKVISALIKAAEKGKDVFVLVELRARFDEENNIGWSTQLVEAGCNVIYGLDTYKVHSKLLLITRKNGNRVEYITQIGTGNYNEKTAELYTDLCLMTANGAIGAEASTVFNSLAMGTVVESTTHLLVAPKCFKLKIIQMIDNEIMFARAGHQTQIIIKCNSVTDKDLIDKLIEASRAGVRIKMFIRGICCFRAGVPGYTENIVVKSIVGRYLEHSRVFIFGYGERQLIYIASADIMTRNTERRVEVGTPIYDKTVRDTILEMIEMLDSDNVKARVMMPDGNYVRYSISDEVPRIDSQRLFFEKYAAINESCIIEKKSRVSKFLSWFKKKERQ